MRLAYTILYVDDVTATAAFYGEAFGFATRLLTPEGDYAELASGETVLAFANHALGSANLGSDFRTSDLAARPTDFELAFTTEAIDADFARAVRAGAAIVREPEAKPWGQRVGYVRDLNGFLIEVCTPMQVGE